MWRGGGREGGGVNAVFFNTALSARAPSYIYISLTTSYESSVQKLWGRGSGGHAVFFKTLCFE